MNRTEKPYLNGLPEHSGAGCFSIRGRFAFQHFKKTVFVSFVHGWLHLLIILQ